MRWTGIFPEENWCKTARRGGTPGPRLIELIRESMLVHKRRRDACITIVAVAGLFCPKPLLQPLVRPGHEDAYHGLALRTAPPARGQMMLRRQTSVRLYCGETDKRP